ncbi:heme ABC exporter, ATP-binding protein CcmA [Orientia chuto str. Dubai]|uniref:Heme ABC exporter, ATP-binding protein CcmA n=1 Tax=Orientia chuto str. Dubai TaxID=1359168 RepID=A0A0F3MJ42_9RICK|nr:heme ABC exporter ATP-binding protein CcmA [Candidatus Orientia mediorientalis]KJV55502.1 heme ABC exporter, ATP-binding protein CcmA [Orientia chuto str. Dubai]
MLTCQNISLFSFYNNEVIFSNLNITLLPGAIAIIRGKNGAGKSSLLKIIGGIQLPTAGEVYINNIQTNKLQRPFLGYLGHQLGLKLNLTVEDNLILWAKFYDSVTLIPAAITYFKLTNILSEKVYKLSSGMKKKVALARIMSCYSKIWLLDEVETNLDQENLQLVYNLVTIQANSGGIILWASHSPSPLSSILEINLERYRK